MANSQEKSTTAPNTESSSPLTETHFSEDYYEEEEVTSTSCCCFHAIFWKENNNGQWVTKHLLTEQEEIKKDGWVVEKVRKLKEISEVLAGPRWKNYIRRFSNVNKKRRMQYQYDPQSYALNFDDGTDKEVEVGFPDFSARFATPVGMYRGAGT